MLDAFIIEELKKRERAKRDDSRPSLEIPLDDDLTDCEEAEDEENEDSNGRVIIIDYEEEDEG